MSKRLAVIVINYRTPALVADCLASLDGQITPGVDEVVVVDNRSGDGSDALVEQTIASRRWHDWVRLIRSPVNGGFSAGNNVGIRAAVGVHHGSGRAGARMRSYTLGSTPPRASVTVVMRPRAS